MPRFHCPMPLASGVLLELPAGAARHVQVLRLQPGTAITLFNGEGGEFEATITRMGRSDVQVQVGAHTPVERETERVVHLALGVPANERMDWLVEKATELGVASIQPLLAERSVLKLKGERAEKKRAHWQGIAVAACEQCGRNRVPEVRESLALPDWIRTLGPGARFLLSLQDGTQPLQQALAAVDPGPVTFLSGPEGGLTAAEEAAALACGFVPVTLGSRTLRAETAPLAALATLTLGA
ncbi:16S rRNA (uracil(1498)-N(3))-methyltransferase [Curvibacter delicatus]|uniref:16S rRNA (uracil(1498)-N(3))-methyltransferase n=1 Tax=Curvibacter delicatus TaxID=80879 RepID=UPI00083166EA|nr:16S rRNA (uracil(1498)-N(3))-methyltransferase [Curvibacter delicatus]